MRLDVSAELETFRKQVRAFVEANAPGRKTRAGVRAPEPDELAGIRTWIAALFEAGYLGIDWPAEFGGRPDAHPLEAFVVVEEITRAGTWLPIGAGSLAAAAVIDHGTDEQRQRFLPRIRAGRDVWCQLFSEPGAGSDLAALSARARPDGTDWVVDGQKVWTTNGQHADMGYLLARTDPGSSRHRGITAFAVSMDTPGITVRPLREITGTTDFNEVFLDGVRIPQENVLGPVDGGWRVALGSLAHERAGVAARGVELTAALADLLQLARGRRVRGRPALEDPATRQAIGALAARVQTNTALVTVAKSRAAAGSEGPGDALIGKILFSETHHDLVQYGVAMQGPDGVLREGDPGVPAGGWWQDAFLYARAYTIAGGANEVLRNQIAERGLGLPREPR